MEHGQGGRSEQGLTAPLSAAREACSGLAPARASRLCPTLAACLLLALTMLAACTAGKSPRGGEHAASRRAPSAAQPASGPATLPRVDPGYLQWLERQSMLGGTQELSAQVSGTERLWRNSAASQRTGLLLEAAPNWLDVNPHTLSADQPLLCALALAGPVDFMLQAGLTGLFLAPAGERGDIWSGRATAAPLCPDGSNVTALHLDPALGDDEDFSRLTQRLDQAHVQLGGELPPAATGLGPDFMLQARRASRFDGLYAMMTVPQKDWDLLPASAEEWDCRPLKPEAVAALRQRGLVPEKLTREGFAWATPGGWAATGTVRGADGQARRWLYRYNGHALRPVLLWQDPSGQARRIFSAAVIRHTGLQQQSLAGLRLEALMGLDAAPDACPEKAAAPGKGTERLTPGLEALDALAREVHRYGGWAMQDDGLPPSLTRAVLDTAVDFTRDSITPAAAAYALLSGDAAPLAALLRASLAEGVDHSRLARGLGDGLRLDWRPLLDLPNGQALMQRAQDLVKTPGADIYITPAALAAQALRLDAATAARQAKAPAMRAACLLLLGWRLGLPGLAFISPQDLTGALPVSQATAGLPAGVGGTPLWAASLRSGSLAAAPLAFGALDSQWTQEQSFARQTARLLQARQAAGLARGKLLHVFSGPAGCVAALSALPGGGYWLLAANFSGQPQRLSCPLPAAAARHSARRAADGQSVPHDGRALKLELDALQTCHVLLEEPKTHVSSHSALHVPPISVNGGERRGD